MNYLKLTLLLTCLLIFEPGVFAQGGMFYDPEIANVPLDSNKVYTLIIEKIRDIQSNGFGTDRTCHGDTSHYEVTLEYQVFGLSSIPVDLSIDAGNRTDVKYAANCGPTLRTIGDGDVYYSVNMILYIANRKMNQYNRVYRYISAETLTATEFVRYKFGFRVIDNETGEEVINLPPPPDECESGAPCSDGSSACIRCPNDCNNVGGEMICDSDPWGWGLGGPNGSGGGNGDDDDCNVSPTIGINE